MSDKTSKRRDVIAFFFSCLDNLNFGSKIQDANTIMENDNENEFN